VNARGSLCPHVLAPRLAEFRTRYPHQLSIGHDGIALVDLSAARGWFASAGPLPDSEMLQAPLGRYGLEIGGDPNIFDRNGWPQNIQPTLARLEQVRFCGTRSNQARLRLLVCHPRDGAPRP